MPNINPDRLWKIAEVADYLGISVNTLRYWRACGDGPPCRHLGKHLRYRFEDVLARVEGQAGE
ncbi:MAG: helix-turn-helix domain-containing protein [Nocardioides sp.]|uniref:helix-turn-helix transcriptional regulator n=1 Tax=Nocardioides sp. TaxID=35761 RepID=UPI0032645AAE